MLKLRALVDTLVLIPAFVVLALASSLAMAADQPGAKPFDPSRDPVADLRAAEQQARAEHKNILVDVGGNWCGWCLVLDRFMHQQPELREGLDRYVILHVNFSSENENKDFFSRYPTPSAFPFFYVLSPSGKLLKAQSTDGFESDHVLSNGYSADRIREFLDRWSYKSPGKTHAAPRLQSSAGL